MNHETSRNLRTPLILIPKSLLQHFVHIGGGSITFITKRDADTLLVKIKDPVSR